LLGDIKTVSAEVNDLAGLKFQHDALRGLGGLLAITLGCWGYGANWWKDVSHKLGEGFEELHTLMSTIMEGMYPVILSLNSPR